MPVKIEKPSPTLPVGYRPANSFPYRVKNGDSFVSLANRLGITPKDLLRFNFNTDTPTHINYYLQHNVGCSIPTPDGKNYTFTNAEPGIIYYPAFNPIKFFGGLEAGSTFNDLQYHGLVIGDDPKNSDFIRVAAGFGMALVLDPKLLDPRPFVYRQYIRGFARVADEKGDWHEWTVYTAKTPHALPSSMTKSDLITFSPDEYREDVEWFENKTAGTAEVRKYGYREAKAVDIDQYLPGQAGHNYKSFDLPNIRIPKTNMRDPAIIGPPSGRVPRKVEVEFGFKACLVQVDGLTPIKIWGQREFSYKGSWLIKNRYNPLSTEPY